METQPSFAFDDPYSRTRSDGLEVIYARARGSKRFDCSCTLCIGSLSKTRSTHDSLSYLTPAEHVQQYSEISTLMLSDLTGKLTTFQEARYGREGVLFWWYVRGLRLEGRPKETGRLHLML